ncbi:hypothetical protein MMC13_003021 [Lambiella insularis]|nr:hypothetical protein [Lambiella insularis]
MSSLVEIFVHISAPSRVIDDGKYRKQALGFLNFEASVRHNLVLRDDTPKLARTIVPLTPYLQNQQRLTSGTLGFEAIQAPPGDVSNRHGSGARLLVSDSFAASDDPPSRIPAFIYTGPRVVIKRTPLLPRPHTAPVPASPCPGAAGHRRSQSDSVETLPSVVPDSQPEFQPETSALKRSFSGSSPFLSSTSFNSPSVKRQRLNPPASALELPRQRKFEHEEVLYPDLEHITSSFSSHVLSSPKASTPQSNGTVEVHPPPPETFSEPFKTHITPGLVQIEAILNLQKYFQPFSTSRGIRPLERGHWLLLFDDKVSLTDREKFWKFLEDYVSEGRFGWGVWCEKSPVVADPRSDYEVRGAPHGAGKGVVDEQQPLRDEILKVYCWGEVVGHIYIVLLMANNRKVKTMNVQWLDASGEVVVRMKNDTTTTL